ncbi:DHA2 family multidrug resistance protein-like MFS transporter [Kitasatospora sp. MAA4]|uniref:MFS transporter n=1 Tax=Kitasatospora sp. MAA4 TaxID=3035093 RepID=UPI00247716B9|nr:MFS transporter [Kitasatospora sp. MAA4]MDH6131854.1 DHA2 family multidrug resistance protein-like MFS transporter [Kitasatospora sp. MAA4]
MDTTEHPLAGRREWIALGVLLLPLLLVSMDVSVLYFAVPFISRDLAPSSTQQLWIFDIYGFVLAGLLITMGALGDRIGRRRLLLTGALGFGAGSVLAAYSTSADTLIAARALLGLAGATLMPSTLGLVRNLFHDAKQRGKAIGIWTGVTTGGIALGPVLSGLLLEHFWWGSVFLVSTPAMVLLLVLGPVLLPEAPTLREGSFDLLSAALSLATVLPVIYGITNLARNGLQLSSVLSVVAGLALGAVFVRRQLTHQHPLIDLELVRRRAFSGSIAMNVLAMFGVVGFAIFGTQYLQSVLGMSPIRAALWSVLPSVVVGGVGPACAALAQRVDRASIMCGGFLAMAAGFAELAFVGVDSALWVVLLGTACYAGGTMAVMSQVTELVMGVVPAERASSASGLMESGTELGGALGMAILGSIGTAVYRSRLTPKLPAGLDADSVRAVRENLGGAQAVAARLPGAGGQAVLHAAREAFTGGMHAAAVAAAVLMAAAGVLAPALLRDVRVESAAVPLDAAELVSA